MLEQTMGVLFDKMKSHVDNGGKLNEYLWEEDEPCYGSDAYCECLWLLINFALMMRGVALPSKPKGLR